MTIAAALRQHRARAVAFWRRSDGVSSLEFALVAPILFFSLLTMADLGFALQERMTMDHVLRAGAQKTIGGGSEPEILDILKSTASKNFVLTGEATTEGEDTLSLAVTRYSACPENPEFAVDVSTICAGPQPTAIFYELSALKDYSGMILPLMTLDRSLVVQIR